MKDAGGGFAVTRAAAPADVAGSRAALAETPTRHDETLNAESDVIGQLLARRSVLPAGSAYERVTSQVLAANARAAESELRAARLRSAAAERNWLPTIGPRVSLNSLGDVISQIVVEQVIFDNGRKKGERAFAKADVEVAAVALAEDTNDRAATALTLYLSAAEARETARIHRLALKDMEHFEYVMSRRVQGGVSDPSDLRVVEQKVAEIRSAIRAAEETAATAIAELGAMSVGEVAVEGTGALPVSPDQAQPLSVLRAEAEKTRAIAAARIDRAGQLPGIGAAIAVGDGGGESLTLGGASLGLGTPARLRAIKAAEEAAGRQVSQAVEDANRTTRRLASQIAALTRQAAESADLRAKAKANLDLFRVQYEVGQRQVMDVVGVYETFAARQVAEVEVKFKAQQARVDLAAYLGVLADGEAI